MKRFAAAVRRSASPCVPGIPAYWMRIPAERPKFIFLGFRGAS